MIDYAFANLLVMARFGKYEKKKSVPMLMGRATASV